MSDCNRRNIVVKDKTWATLKALARDEERSMSELIREALHDLFEKRIKPDRLIYDSVNDRFIKRAELNS